MGKKFYFELLLKKWFGIKLAGIGLSIGPFHSIKDKQTAINILKNFEFISTRDNSSYQFCTQHLPNLKLTYSSDLIGIIADTYRFDKVKKSSNIIGVSLMQPDTSYKSIDVQHTMKTLLEFAIKQKMTIRVFILNNHPINGDITITKKFIDMLSDGNIPYEIISLEIGALEVWKYIAECTMMVSYRLHGAITAYLSNVPFYLFEYHQKCTDFLDDINMNYHTKHINNCTDFLQHPILPTLHYSKYIALSIKNFSSTKF